jgi:membrane protein required for colicin V production
MNGLDVVILVTFFASTLIGAMRGFTKEILSLFSWGGAIALAYIFLPLGRSWVSPYIVNPMMADGAALFCMFVVSLVFLSIIASIIAGYIHESSFRGVDHSLGFGFGMLRGVVFISTAELIFSTFSPRHSQSLTFQQARFIPMVRKGGDTVLQLLPASLRATILEQAIKVENQVNAKVQDHLKHTAPNMFAGGAPKMGLEGGFGPGGHAGTAPGASSGGNGMQGQGYDGSAQSHQMSPQGSGQGTMQSQMAQPPMMHQQGAPIHPGMGAVPGQAPQYPSSPHMPPQSMHPGQGGGPQMNGQMSPPVSPGIAQSAMPQDTQATVDQLARLTPQSSPTEDSGYTRGQRDDMNRLFQAADGE